MSEPPSKSDVPRACLEAVIRKALADGWAYGLTLEETNRMAVQKAHECFPEMGEGEISGLVETIRRKPG